MLRPAPKSRSGSSRQDVKKDFSRDQLAGIGAVVMVWNELEFMLDCALYSGEELPAECFQDDLPKRGLDEKVRQVGQAAEKWGLPETFIASIRASAKAFSDLKNYRNAVVHSRIYDSQTAICNRIKRSGDIEEVLITPQSLNWLYEQIAILRYEMRCVIAVFDLVRNTATGERTGMFALNEHDPIPEASEWVRQIDGCRQKRELLGAAPSFTINIR